LRVRFNKLLPHRITAKLQKHHAKEVALFASHLVFAHLYPQSWQISNMVLQTSLWGLATGAGLANMSAISKKLVFKKTNRM